MVTNRYEKFDRTVLRKVFGVDCVSDELYELYGDMDIVKRIKINDQAG